MSILKYKMDPGVEVSCVLRRRSCGFGFGSKSVRVTLNLGISYDTLSLSLSREMYVQYYLVYLKIYYNRLKKTSGSFF